MIRSDINQYYAPACKNLFGDFDVDDLATRQSLYKKLDAAIGVIEYYSWCFTPEFHDMPLSNDLKWLLTNLAGPHGKTILKMYRIKIGLET